MGVPRTLTETLSPRLPLALLEALRAHDTPPEILPGDGGRFSLPHRLGLTDVVSKEIRRYRRVARRWGRVPTTEVEDLLRLIARRPDAEAIFDAAGRRLARARHRRGGPAFRIALRRLPAAMRQRAALRSLRRSWGRLLVGTALRIAEDPPGLEVENSLTARAALQEAGASAVDLSGPAGAGGSPCTLYGALLEEMISLYSGRPWRAAHDRCQARGDGRCRWRLALER